MFTFGLAEGSRGFDPLTLLLAALALEAVVGEARPLFRLVPHPVRLIGGLVGWLEGKLNRERRGEAMRAVRGAFVVLFVVALTGAVGWGVAWLGSGYRWGMVLEVVLVATLVAQRSLYAHVRAVGRALDKGGLDEGRQAVSHIVGRRPESLDGHGVARAAIESCAENYSDAVVAPVFWYVLFGFPGLLVYKAVNTLDSMIGHMSPRYRAFGFVAARLDDVLNLVPARLAALNLVLAALIAPTARPGRALKTMLRDHGKHRSPNAGWPEAAAAGALGLALAGPRAYAEERVDGAWIGDGTARATAHDIRRMLYLYVVACLINAMWVAALAVVRLRLFP